MYELAETIFSLAKDEDTEVEEIMPESFVRTVAPMLINSSALWAYNAFLGEPQSKRVWAMSQKP